MDPRNSNQAGALSNLQTADLYRMQVRELRHYAMFMMDTDGILVSWNAGVESLLGYSEQEWLGQHASIIFTPAELAAEVCEAEMQHARERGTSTDIRWHRHKSGTSFFANGFMNSLYDQQGNLIGYAKIMSDETARKQLQDALTESNTALEQFAHAASHDLQEPLRTLRSYAQLLTENYQGRLDADADQFLAFIMNAAARMETLIADLLAYAKFTTEHERPVSVALDEDLEAALTHLDGAIQENGGTVTHDPLPVLAVDRGQMVRLFQNLIGNALKYGKKDEPSKVHISVEQTGTEWLFSIRDNGIGFDKKDAETIFQPFKRLHDASEYPGTGVGLAICRRIVRAQGGRIWAESVAGEGSTFFFTLPVEGRPAPKYTPPISQGHAADPAL